MDRTMERLMTEYCQAYEDQGRATESIIAEVSRRRDDGDLDMSRLVDHLWPIVSAHVSPKSRSAIYAILQSILREAAGS